MKSKMTADSTRQATARQSNLELMRIVLMLVIIAHHLVVNSGLIDAIAPGAFDAKTLFVVLFGMWGKAAINAFVMITGYFMCTSQLTRRKMLKLLGTFYFWEITCDLLFIFAGRMSINECVMGLLYPITSINKGFTASFLFMYLLIPFMNGMIEALDQCTMKRLLVLLAFVFVVVGTFVPSSAVFSEVGWYVFLYILAAYIRLYPPEWGASYSRTAIAFVCGIVASVFSIVILLLLGARLGWPVTRAYYLMIDSNKLMAFIAGVTCFLFFLNVNVKSSRGINLVASSTFGVLLIHSGSNAVRRLIWGDLLNVVNAWGSMDLMQLALYCCFAVGLVFIVCSCMELIRQVLFRRLSPA